MLTAASIVKHAAGQSETMQGGGLFSFIKYKNRGISQALTAAATGGAAYAFLG